MVLLSMEQRQNGWLYIIGIVLGVISNAWINSVFKTVEVRGTMPYNMELDVMYSLVSIAFNIFFVVYLTFAGLIFFKITRWKLIVVDIIFLVIPIAYTFPWIILFNSTPQLDISEWNILQYIYLAFGFLAGFFAEFFLKVISRHYEEYRDRILQKRLLRGDLRVRLRNFCNTWEDRDYIIPHTDLRKELVSIMKDIRESLNDEFAKLQEEEKTRLREISKDVLRVASEFRGDSDETWSKKVESELEEICKRLKDIVKELG